MKKRLFKREFDFLQGEVDQWASNGMLPEELGEQIMGLYERRKGINPAFVILTLAALLIGTGIISFVSANWQYFPAYSKIGGVMLSYLSFIGLSIYFEKKMFMLSRALLYIAILTFGSGIFLIGQVFHLSGQYYEAFLAWSLGVLPIAIYYRDKVPYIFGAMLLTIYFLNLSNYGIILGSLLIVIFAIALYLIEKFIISGGAVSLANAIIFTAILSRISFGEFKIGFDTLILFILGLIFIHVKYFNKHVSVMLYGIILNGITGIILTYKYFWHPINIYSSNDYAFGQIASIIFAVLFAIYLFWLVYRGFTYPVFFICFLTLRYFTDISFGFMDKALYFIMCGLIIGAYGLWIAKRLKNKGKKEVLEDEPEAENN